MKKPYGQNTRRALNKLIPSLAIAAGIIASPLSGSAALLAYYPFDTDALDYSGNGQGLQLMNATISTTKILGSGGYNASTAGTSTLIKRAQRSSGPGNVFDGVFNDFTVSIWAKANSWNNGSNPERLLIGKHNNTGVLGWEARITRGNAAPAGAVAFEVNDGLGNGTTVNSLAHSSADASVFHHIVLQYHQENAITGRWLIYWDGQLEANETHPMTRFTSHPGQWLQIGNIGNDRNATAGQSFLGNVDDTSFWSDQLSAKQIAAIYGLGKLAGVALLDKYTGHADTQINELVAAFNVSGSAVAGGYNWSYDAGTGAATVGTISGSVGGGDAFIVLDPSGSGMKVGAAVKTMTLGTAVANVNDIFVAVGDPDPNITVTVPSALVAAGDVDVTLTSANPAVAIPTGSPGGSQNIHFAGGGGISSVNVPIHALAAGTVVFSITATTPSIFVKNTITVHTPQLVGQWLSGAPSLVEQSGYQPAGTHDGTAVGSGALTFDPDVPSGFTGNSLNFSVGTAAVQIMNTATADSGYKNTFDDQLSYTTTITFWAKGIPPGSFNPFVSKNGETDNPTAGSGLNNPGQGFGNMGWQVRRNGSSNFGCYTARNVSVGDTLGVININDSNWHHFAAVRNGITGKRQLYIDGTLDTGINSTTDFGAVGLPMLSHLMLGGRDKNSAVDGIYNGKLFDVRIYNGVLTTAQLTAIRTSNPNTVGSISAAVAQPITMLVGDPNLSAAINVYVPAAQFASTPVTVNLSSSAPGVAVTTPLSVTFNNGDAETKTVDIQVVGAGYATITATSSIGMVGSIPVAVTAQGLLGHWLSGSASLADTAGFAAPGTHDLVGVGAAVANLTFSSDVPNGFTGQSANFGGNVMAKVANSSTREGAGYKPTFEGIMGQSMSIAFWAKGQPAGGYKPWVTKRGEDSFGWQVRLSGDMRYGCFTMRNSPGADDPQGAINIFDAVNTWHHFTAVWDGVAGTRQLYVDGVLDSGVNLTGDTAPYGSAANFRLGLGGREKNDLTGPEDIFTGKLYDVRIYNQAISAPQIQALIAPPLGTITAASIAMTVGDPDSSMTVTVPTNLLASGSVDVTLTSDKPAVAIPTGAVAGSLVVHFAQNGANSQAIPVHAVGAGLAKITGNSTSVTIAGSVSVLVTQNGPAHGLVGHWLSGPASLADTGVLPPGTHDAAAVNGGTATFTTDVPPGFFGQSITLAGGAALKITNSSTADAGYVPTYDNFSKTSFSVAFWAKGAPGGWNPWIPKRGEDGRGWQVRQHGNATVDTFTLRGSASGNEDPQGNTSISGLWHHYAAIWDGVAGTRQLYVDGALDSGVNLTGDFAPYNGVPNFHLILGGRETSDGTGIESAYAGQLYDVRIYDYPIAPSVITNITTPVLGGIAGFAEMNTGDPDVANAVTVTVPASLLAAQGTTVTLHTDAAGAATTVPATLIFAQNGALSQTVSTHAVGAGTAHITATCPDVNFSGSAAIVVVTPTLIGHWVSGDATLDETSGYRPPGTHYGTAIGSNPGNQGFTSDVPAGFSGQSLSLAGNAAVQVANSATGDLGYVNTFDNVVANGLTVAFWEKVFPLADWHPWIAKKGEDTTGYQVRRSGGSSHAGFTIRSTPGADDTEGSIDLTDNGVWHHIAAVWDGVAGIRQLYVDGVLDINLTAGDTGPMGLAADSHLVFGARDKSGSLEDFSPMNLYDIRIYDKALSQHAIAQVMIPVVPAPALTIRPWTGNQVRISWPVAGSAGYVLQKSLVLPAAWGAAGLSVGVEGSENAAYAPIANGAEFYRLIK